MEDRYISFHIALKNLQVIQIVNYFDILSIIIRFSDSLFLYTTTIFIKFSPQKLTNTF